MANMHHVNMTEEMDSNASFANLTEGPCDVGQFFSLFNVSALEQCNLFQAVSEAFGRPVCASISIIGIIFNVITVFVIRRSVRRRRTQAQIHLLTLAFSDISVGIAAMLFAALGWSCDLCLPCSQQGVCFTAFMVAGFFWRFSWNVNRVMTISIAIVRAKAVRNATNSLRSQNKTMRRTMVELGMIVTLGFILIQTNYQLIMHALSTYHSIPFWQLFSIVSTINDTFLAITMASVTAFILIKLRHREHPVFSAAEIDFQRLVALVALVFCLGLFVSAFLLGSSAHDGNFENHRHKTLPLAHIETVLNSSVNLIVYLVASSNFRAVFVEFCRGSATES